MNYKIIGNNDYYHIPISIFTNRGITNVSEYTHLTDDVLISYDNLDNINEAVQMLDKHIKSNSKIAIIVDCDAIQIFRSVQCCYDVFLFEKA